MDADERYRQLCERAEHEPPRIALVLGSGLGELAQRVCPLASVPYACVPGLEQPTIAGHDGRLILGTWAGQAVLLFCGRLHYYEGHSWSRVAGPAHIARQVGARTLVLTNAVGGIRDDLVPGSLMAIADHLEWARSPRQLSRPSPYDAELIRCFRDASHELGWQLPTGVYAQVTGPCYETRAEIRALQSLGVDAVGMSTACEIQAGFDLGLTCAAISCITNRAAGLGSGPIHHGEVLTRTAEMKGRLGELLERVLRSLSVHSRNA